MASHIDILRIPEHTSHHRQLPQRRHVMDLRHMAIDSVLGSELRHALSGFSHHARQHQRQEQHVHVKSMMRVGGSVDRKKRYGAWCKCKGAVS